jgi:hypothetical protein
MMAVKTDKINNQGWANNKEKKAVDSLVIENKL